MHPSSTQYIPDVSAVPRHVAIIMDGNGRWATDRHLPRTAGHIRGVQAVRRVVRYCAEKGVKYLTLFSFSSENWRRPKAEVEFLMRLFLRSLQKEVKALHEHQIALHVIGDTTAFSEKIQRLIREAEALTQHNDRLHLTVAANYGGRWDLLQAMQQYIHHHATPFNTQESDGEVLSRMQAIELPDEAAFESYLSMAWAPEPDLLIRTGGEQRLSNFLIWQLAYTELYFSPTYWPDIDNEQLDQAFHWYAYRERRFGRTSAQVAGTIQES